MCVLTLMFLHSLGAGVCSKPEQAQGHPGHPPAQQREAGRVSQQVPHRPQRGRAVQRREGLPHQADQGAETGAPWLPSRLESRRCFITLGRSPFSFFISLGGVGIFFSVHGEMWVHRVLDASDSRLELSVVFRCNLSSAGQLDWFCRGARCARRRQKLQAEPAGASFIRSRMDGHVKLWSDLICR